MPYKYDTQFNSPVNSFTAGRGGALIIEINMHHWGADGQTHDGVVAFFQSGPGTSAHYVASGGRVSCLVDLYNTAWAAGNFTANLRSVTIECRPELSSADFETVAELIADIRKVYGNLPLTPHNKYANTSCPGRYLAMLDRLSKRANEILKGQPAKPVTPVTPAPKFKTETDVAIEVIAGKWGNGTDRAKRLRAAGWDPNKIQNRVNQRLGAVVPKVDIDDLARRAIRGEFGNGAERARRLGANAAAVQARVNQLLS